MKDDWLADMKKSAENRGVLDLLWDGFTKQHVLSIIETLGREDLDKVTMVYIGNNAFIWEGISLLIEAGLNPKAILRYNNRRVSGVPYSSSFCGRPLSAMYDSSPPATREYR